MGQISAKDNTSGKTEDIHSTSNALDTNLATYLTGERYPTTVQTMTVIDGTDGSATVTLTFPASDYDDGDLVTISGSNSNPSIDGTYLITKSSSTQGTITIDGTTWTADGNTGTITIEHLNRGLFSVSSHAGQPQKIGAFTTAATSANGTPFRMPSGYASFQATIAGTTSATDFAATVNIQASNVSSAGAFVTLGTITLSATGASTVGDTDGFAIDAPWVWGRAQVTGLAGLGSTCEVWMGY